MSTSTTTVETWRIFNMICILNGQSSSDTFTIDISSRTTVNALKELIWNKIKTQCNDQDHVTTALDLTLWDIQCHRKACMEKPILANELPFKNLLAEGKMAGDYFRMEWIKAPENISILVERDRVMSAQTLEVLKEYKMEYESRVLTAPTSSSFPIATTAPTTTAATTVLNRYGMNGESTPDGLCVFEIVVRSSGKIPTWRFYWRLDPTVITMNQLKDQVSLYHSRRRDGHGYKHAHMSIVYPKGIVNEITEDITDRFCTDELLRNTVERVAKVPTMRVITVHMDMTYKKRFADLRAQDANFLFLKANQTLEQDMPITYMVMNEIQYFEEELSTPFRDIYEASKAKFLKDFKAIQQVRPPSPWDYHTCLTYANLALETATEVFGGSFMLHRNKRILGPYGEGIADFTLECTPATLAATTTDAAGSRSRKICSKWNTIHSTDTTTINSSINLSNTNDNSSSDNPKNNICYPIVAVTMMKGLDSESALAQNMFLMHAMLSEREGVAIKMRESGCGGAFAQSVHSAETYGIVTNGSKWIILRCANFHEDAQRCEFQEIMCYGRSETPSLETKIVQDFQRVVGLLLSTESQFLEATSMLEEEEATRGTTAGGHGRGSYCQLGSKRKREQVDPGAVT
ncbi:hypothetical protein BGZ83_009337 [Gryganskiella cystojenkinii]|nr:hypothetical protein BGZ83_009337 [Gryganskiella cystojenkinii]